MSNELFLISTYYDKSYQILIDINKYVYISEFGVLYKKGKKKIHDK